MTHGRSRRLNGLAAPALAAFATIPVGVGLVASPAGADGSTDKYYSIANSKSHNTGKVLTASGSSAGSVVTLATYTGSNRQHWHWEPSPGPGMHLVNVSSRMCLHADFVGAALKQQLCTSSEKQEWLWGFFNGTRHAAISDACLMQRTTVAWHESSARRLRSLYAAGLASSARHDCCRLV